MNERPQMWGVEGVVCIKFPGRTKAAPQCNVPNVTYLPIRCYHHLNPQSQTVTAARRPSHPPSRRDEQGRELCTIGSPLLETDLTMMSDVQKERRGNSADPKSIMFLLRQARTLARQLLSGSILCPTPEAIGVGVPQVIQDLFQSLGCLEFTIRGS